ncbi:MAG: hypothetical protein NC831_03705 [Candidatus Omnitrophica bacterium]|nr:hypothetical protein [Candidatus Omnitrophota bacterium]
MVGIRCGRVIDYDDFINEDTSFKSKIELHFEKSAVLRLQATLSGFGLVLTIQGKG